MSGCINLGDLIRRDRDLSKIAIVDLGGGQSPRDFTFAQLDAMAKGVARALAKRGLQRGDRIALLAANRAEYIAAYYGIMRAGLVAVPTNFKFPRATIHFIIRDAGAKLVFCDAPRAADCPPELPAVSFAPSPAGGGPRAAGARGGEAPALRRHEQRPLPDALRASASPLQGEARFGDFLDPGPFDAITPAPDEPAMFLYTSGSTGTPK